MPRVVQQHEKWGGAELIFALLLGACAVLVASDAWADILQLALGDEESSHVFLVPPVIAWIAWMRRGRIRYCTTAGRGWGTLILAAGWLFWSVGYRRQVQSFWHGGAVLMLVGATVTALGRDLILKFAPALAALVFIVPMPATVRTYSALPLQRLTAQVTQTTCEVLGMSVQRQGNLLNVNGVEVAIAEACNGMRMVFTLFLACYLFAFVTPLRAYVRFVILALSPLTAVIANVVRLVPTVWVFGHMPSQTAERFHDISGWFMLVAAFLGLMGIVKVLRWALVPVSEFNLGAV